MKIIELIDNYKKGMEDHPERIKFKCQVNNEYDKIVAYSDIVDFIEQPDGWDGIYKFQRILDHKGPLKWKDPDYNGSRYNVQVEWVTGEITWEPVNQADGKGGVWWADPVILAIYAKKHGLLNTPGWKMPGFKKIVEMQDCTIASDMQTNFNPST